MNSQDLNLFFSLASIGFFGGFTHCMSMCGPFVITQVSSNLKNLEVSDYRGIKKISKIALIPYHLGRITTYSLIGFLIAFLRISIDQNIGFEILSTFLILLAGLFFINFFVKENRGFFKKLKLLKIFEKINFSLNFKFLNIFYNKNKSLINILFSMITPKINFLLNNSRGWSGYFLGIILGFIPCGMLYGAFAIAGAFSISFYAFLGMIIFGASTFIALFVVGFLAKLTIKLPEFKIIANIVMLVNIIVLFKIFFNKII